MDDREKKEKEEEGKIKVVDKRRFHEEGGEIKVSPDTPEEKKETPKQSSAKKDEEEKGQQRSPKGEPVQIDFTTFVLSLVSSTQVHLGLIANPVTGKHEKDMLAARQSIDILDMLKEKTKGNLAGEEERLLDYVLYDLRMKYVELNK